MSKVKGKPNKLSKKVTRIQKEQPSGGLKLLGREKLHMNKLELP